ncbi:hypothetical protein MICAK_2700001 [Microcystis aeruginosa PCC 9701]|uniref:Uncharacterized protein n=1 Tax=Microcystis aeruginosa PCC 9701 TaxID=721123 RepID=I4IR55_MICAE|nr:hypothetical protein MICAK_2700001 [Microcystis aeruginosa PCC 9701]
MTDIHARMLAKPAFVVTQIKKNGITPSASLVIRVTKPHLVYQKFELKNPLLVGKKAKSEYFLLMRDKEQQIEVKINLSPENYRQFLETMTEDQ